MAGVVEERVIGHPPEVIWTVLSRPADMPAWHPKCVRVEEEPEGKRFRATFTMGGASKAQETRGQVVLSETNQCLRLRYEYEQAGKTGYFEETYTLKPDREGTRVRHEADFSGIVAPWWLKKLIGLLGRFGRKAGEGPLDGLSNLLDEVG